MRADGRDALDHDLGEVLLQVAVATAVVLGYLIYRGAIAINLTKFFTWTGAFLILVAAGVLSYGVHDLQEAAILPGLHTIAFDVSGAVDPNSWYGTILKGIFNFSPVTTVLEAVVWLVYVVPVMFLFFQRKGRASNPRRRTAAPPAASPPRARSLLGMRGMTESVPDPGAR